VEQPVIAWVIKHENDDYFPEPVTFESYDDREYMMRDPSGRLFTPEDREFSDKEQAILFFTQQRQRARERR